LRSEDWNEECEGFERLKDWIACIQIKSQAEFVTLPGFFKYSLGEQIKGASAQGQMNEAPFLGLRHGQLQI
jgi:hypothetical protein